MIPEDYGVSLGRYGLEQLNTLAIALLDFNHLQDVETWLQHHAPQDNPQTIALQQEQELISPTAQDNDGATKEL